MTQHHALNDLNIVLEKKDEESVAPRSELDRARNYSRRQLDEISDLRRQLNELETATTQPMPGNRFEDMDTVYIGGRAFVAGITFSEDVINYGGKNYYAEKPSNHITEEFLNGIGLGQQTIEENNRLKAKVQDLETQLQSEIDISTRRFNSMELLNHQLAEKDRQLSAYGAYIEDGKLKIRDTSGRLSMSVQDEDVFGPSTWSKVLRSVTYTVEPL